MRVFPRKDWRRRPDLNRGWRFCRPLPYRLATAPRKKRMAGLAARPDRPGEKKMLERETGFEPATSTLARSHSTTELFPPDPSPYHTAALASSTWHVFRRDSSPRNRPSPGSLRGPAKASPTAEAARHLDSRRYSLTPRSTRAASS